MALSVKFSRHLALYPRQVFFQWDLLTPTEDGVYTFHLYRSGSPDGPWETLATNLVDTYHYFDAVPTVPLDGTEQINLMSLHRDIYYKIVCVPPSGTANQVSDVARIEPGLERKQQQIRRKILHDIQVQLSKLNGVEFAVCKRRHWGARCTKCYDKASRGSVRGNCTTCFGTTFTGGYFDPVMTWGRRGTPQRATSIQPAGVVDANVTQITLLDVPRVFDGDLLVSLRDNQRFVVKQWLTTELRTVTVHQKLVVSELARNAIEYALQVDPYRSPKLF